MSKVHIPEWLKNLLIVFLSISAFWLLSLSPLYVDSPLETWVTQLLAQDDTPTQTTVSLTAAAQPLAISIVNTGGRYTAQYDSEAVNAAFDSLGAILGEALHSASFSAPISESRWQDALQENGFYLEFGAAIPLSVLAEWTGGEGTETALTGSVHRIGLSRAKDSNSVQLIFQDSDTGIFHACSTTLDSDSHLLPVLSSWMPDSSFFAFEEERYSACDPYTLIGDALQPDIYLSATSLSAANTDAVELVLEALSYSISSGSSYTINGGTRYTDGTNTFQLTSTGELTYRASDVSHLPIPSTHETPTVTECIETTRQLVQNTIGQFCGNAQLHLSSLEESSSGLRITYEYRLDGVPVSLRQSGWAAEFTIADGGITAFTLHFRSYTPSGETTPLLPELQAAAALSALDTNASKLFPTYRDNGASSVSACWAAR